MKIKTFPLQFTEDRLNEIREAAHAQGLTIKEFILQAVQEKIERVKKGK